MVILQDVSHRIHGDWYNYLYICLISMVYAGKYTMTMDPSWACLVRHGSSWFTQVRNGDSAGPKTWGAQYL